MAGRFLLALVGLTLSGLRFPVEIIIRRYSRTLFRLETLRKGDERGSGRGGRAEEGGGSR